MLRFKKADGSEYPEWVKRTFADVGSVSMCKRVFKEQTDTEGDVPFFKIGTFGSEPDAYISYDLFAELKEKYSYPEKGAVLISASGTLGRTVVFDGNDSYFQDSNIIWLDHDDTVLDSFLEYLYMIVHWQEPEGGTIKRLYNKNFLETEFRLPCLEEQQKIADCLSSVDAVIADYEAQVENMQNQKKGVMQKLFSQEVRFKADDGSEYPEWEYLTLDSLGEFYGGLSGKTKDDFGRGDGRFVTYMNVYKNAFSSQDMLEAVDVGANERQNTVEYGDILMSQSSETVEEVGLSSVYLFDDKPYLNSFCFGFHLADLSKTYPQYMGYLMRSESVRKQIMREGQGISRINLSPNRIRTITLGIPCFEEQQKIAGCLIAFDEAIEDLQKTVEHWKNIKKGLLQQLFA